MRAIHRAELTGRRHLPGQCAGAPVVAEPAEERGSIAVAAAPLVHQRQVGRGVQVRPARLPSWSRCRATLAAVMYASVARCAGTSIS